MGNAKDPLLDGVLDKRGCPSLREAASILYNSDLFVGGISGLMHLARFVGCPSVIVYSHAEPETLVHYLCNIDIHPKHIPAQNVEKATVFLIKSNAVTIMAVSQVLQAMKLLLPLNSN